MKPLRDHLVQPVQAVWSDLGIKHSSDWNSQGSFLGVGLESANEAN
jgi:5-aminolevulinate synthase